MSEKDLTVSTECGHSFQVERGGDWEAALTRLARSPVGTTGATFDCRDCGTLCILVANPDGVWGRKFHQFMHEQDSRWPADGKGTGHVDF